MSVDGKVDGKVRLGHPVAMKPQYSRRFAAATALAAGAVLVGCAGINIGIGLPIGGLGSVGVSVGSDGRIGGGISVGSGGVMVGVGGTAQMPRPADAATSAAPAASAPTPAP